MFQIKIFKILSALLLLIFLTSAGIYYSKLEALIWYALNLPSEDSARFNNSLKLNHYQVTIDAKTIEGVSDLSGLTFNHQTNTLFSVLNSEPYIVEIDTEGNLLRQIPVIGASDLEGISHIEDDRYVIVDEREQRLIWINLDENTQKIDITEQPQITLNFDSRRNKGLEGVSWDEINKRLLIVKERNPLQVIQISGVENLYQPISKLEINLLTPTTVHRTWLRDLSSITHTQTNALLLLSDESRLVVEYDAEGKLSSYLSLWKGSSGLAESIPQAEGLTIGPDKSIYVTSEPNLFYKFSPAL